MEVFDGEHHLDQVEFSHSFREAALALEVEKELAARAEVEQEVHVVLGLERGRVRAHEKWVVANYFKNLVLGLDLLHFRAPAAPAM